MTTTPLLMLKLVEAWLSPPVLTDRKSTRTKLSLDDGPNRILYLWLCGVGQAYWSFADDGTIKCALLITERISVPLTDAQISSQIYYYGDAGRSSLLFCAAEAAEYYSSLYVTSLEDTMKLGEVCQQHYSPICIFLLEL